MEPSLVIAAYRCEIDGKREESIDIQVRYFKHGTRAQIEESLRAEPLHTYPNDGGGVITWPLVGILASESFDTPEHGAEIIGFITGCHEFAKWTLQTNRREPAAQRQIAAIDATRGEFPVYIEIGIPYRISVDEWACPVALNGLHNKLHEAHGNDSFQALMLAQNLAKTLLNAFVEDGGRLLDAPGGTVIDVQRLFTNGT